MTPLNQNELQNELQIYIADFHQIRLKKLAELDLSNILKRKNPYLFKAKHISTGEELIKSILNAYLSSQEETLFGDVLERLAIYVSSVIDNGHKSSAEGIDLEFTRDGIHYLISIKSGPNWGNSSQIKK